MSGESVKQPLSGPGDRFAQNIVAEAVTIGLILFFGIVSSILIVRGLPRAPVYEFYLFVLVFTWVNILIPVGIVGMDVALRKHVPEVMGKRSSLLIRVVGVSLVTVIIASLGMIGVVDVLLVWFPPNFFVPSYAVPFLLLALWTVPLTAVSTVLQGAFRGMQQMRYCTMAMGLYHGGYFVGLVVLFVNGTMTLLTVILINFAVSGLTIAYEVGILQKLIDQYKRAPIQKEERVAIRPMGSTAIQALCLALLGSVFLYVPLLIANMFRTSDVILAGLGLALSVALWVQQGLSAPFRVLMPRTAGEVAQQAWSTIKGYMTRAWKLGVLLCAFVAVVAVFYATPALIVLFAGEGMVAWPFFVLMAGSFFIYPLAVMMTDTLIGVGRIRLVLTTNMLWTIATVLVLWFLTPIGHEVIVAVIWVVGIPFFLVYLGLYQRYTKAQIGFAFLPKAMAVLAIIALLAWGIIGAGAYIITAWSLVGLLAWFFQIGLILTLFLLAITYLWSLLRIRVLDSGDRLALLRMSRVVDPVSRPVSWLVERMGSDAVE